MNEQQWLDWIEENMKKADVHGPLGKYTADIVLATQLSDLISRLPEEKELPVIPQFVADWIERSKQKRDKLIGVMLYFYVLGIDSDDINVYINENYETFVRAWIDGYTIEKELYWIVSFQAKHFYSLLDEISYFKEFITDRETSIRIKPNGCTFKDDRDVYKFKEKEKAEAVALLIGGEVEEVPNE